MFWCPTSSSCSAAASSLKSTISASSQNCWSTPSRRTSRSRRRCIDLHVDPGTVPPTLRPHLVSSMPNVTSTPPCSPHRSHRAVATLQVNRRELLCIQGHVLDDLVVPGLGALADHRISAIAPCWVYSSGRPAPPQCANGEQTTSTSTPYRVAGMRPRPLTRLRSAPLPHTSPEVGKLLELGLLDVILGVRPRPLLLWPQVDSSPKRYVDGPAAITAADASLLLLTSLLLLISSLESISHRPRSRVLPGPRQAVHGPVPADVSHTTRCDLIAFAHSERPNREAQSATKTPLMH
mmetsp:Transcript_114742/g.364754  ORF Transcript_114742/g.364754 Transcript_114742/m.364754 type:complete len:293 (+) Transcript_114742:126-1004(+)